MRFKKVTGKSFYADLMCCHTTVLAGDGHNVFADLDGPAFKAYYCENHARIFIGVYPTGLVYADRLNEYAGDYKRLAYLNYKTLELEVERSCPQHLKDEITRHASTIQAQRGNRFEVSSSGQYVILGA